MPLERHSTFLQALSTCPLCLLNLLLFLQQDKNSKWTTRWGHGRDYWLLSISWFLGVDIPFTFVFPILFAVSLHWAKLSLGHSKTMAHWCWGVEQRYGGGGLTSWCSKLVEPHLYLGKLEVPLIMVDWSWLPSNLAPCFPPLISSALLLSLLFLLDPFRKFLSHF